MKPKNIIKETREGIKFEEALKRLEEVVQELESGDLPLEDILKKYEEGNKLSQVCASKLNEAEQRIEILMQEKNGPLTLKPFDSAQGEEGEGNNEDSDGEAVKEEKLFDSTQGRPSKKRKAEPEEEELF